MIVALNTIAIFNLLLLGIVLVTRKPRRNANYLLAFVVITPGFAILFNTLVYTDQIYRFPYTILSSFGFNFLWAPAFLFYVLVMTGKKIKFNVLQLFHFVPFFIFLIFAVWFLKLEPSERNILFGSLKTSSPFPIMQLNSLMIYQVFIYMIISLIVIHQYNKKIKNTFSDFQKHSMKWLMEYILISMGLSVFAFIPMLINPEIKVFVTFLPIASSLFYIFVVYKTMSQPSIFSKEMALINESENEKDKEEIKLYNKKPNDQIYSNAEKLEAFIKETKIYRDPDLNIKILADKIQIPTYILSITINKRYNKNFFEFINSYRVEDAKKMLNNPAFSHLTIEAIAYDCGFGSRASFYNTFKKLTHQNPADFKRPRQ